MSPEQAAPSPSEHPGDTVTPPSTGPPERTTEPDGAPPPDPPAPSPQWVGAVVSGGLLASVIWLLGYTLLDLGWQQQLGGWNYLIAALLSTITSQVLQRWHGDPRRG